MYLTKQRVQAARRKAGSEQLVISSELADYSRAGAEEAPQMEVKHGAGPELNYKDMRIQYRPSEDRVGVEEGSVGRLEPADGMNSQNAVVQRSPIPIDMIMSLVRWGVPIAAILGILGVSGSYVWKCLRQSRAGEKGQQDAGQQAEEKALPEALRQEVRKEQEQQGERPEEAPPKDLQGEKAVEEEEAPPKELQGEKAAEEEEAPPKELRGEAKAEEEETPDQRSLLSQRFGELNTIFPQIIPQEVLMSKNPPDEIRLWRRLRYKPADATEDDLERLEGFIEREIKKGKKRVQKQPSEPMPAAAVEDPRDAEARTLLGEPDVGHSYETTPCKEGSMLKAFLVNRGIVEKNEKVLIGHQSGRSKEPKRFVVIIRGWQYLIFCAQHPGEDFKEYEISECVITQAMGYEMDLEGRLIYFGKKGFELNDGSGRQI